jgi:hypothetical protein
MTADSQQVRLPRKESARIYSARPTPLLPFCLLRRPALAQGELPKAMTLTGDDSGSASSAAGSFTVAHGRADPLDLPPDYRPRAAVISAGISVGVSVTAAALNPTSTNASFPPRHVCRLCTRSEIGWSVVWSTLKASPT